MRRLLTWIGIWTAVGFAVATQWYLVERRLAQDPRGWWWQVGAHVPEGWLWGLAALAVVRLARRVPLDRARLATHGIIHLGVSLYVALAVVVAAAAVQAACDAAAGRPADFLARFADGLAMFYHRNVLVYWAIVAAVQLRDTHRALEERRLREALLEARLAEARLQALTLQLQPHFLFNALNAAAELMHEDVAAADRMLGRVCDLLRATLETRDRPEVALDRELELAERYLDIQRVRYGDRLAVRLDVAADARAGRVPALILLPLVENAVRHGVAGRAGPAEVGIRARRDRDALRLEVWDDGPGVGAGAARAGGASGGIGLANTRERLAQLYGAAHRLELTGGAGGGLTVRLEIPYREAA